MCNQCNYTHVKITRLLGSTKSIQMWSEEDRAEFFKTTKGQSSADLKAVHATMQSKYERHEEYYDEGGEFLPLAAWTVKGFDAVSIEGNSTDANTRMHPLLGMTYRVDILSKGKRGAKGESAVDNLSTNKKVRKSELAELAKLVAPSPGDEVVSNKDESDKESSSSSDSSSSSSSRKKRHKGKKNKKGKMSKKEKKRNKSKRHAAKNNERLKKENKEAKEQQKGVEQAKKATEKQHSLKFATANQIISKVTPVMASLRNTMIVARAANVDDAVMVPSRQELAKLEEMLQQANMVKLDVSKPLPVERAKDRQCYAVDIGVGWGRCHAEHSSCPFS
jgi:hypothetical protein